MDGWVLIDKPAGPSSAAVVARVRRVFDARKAGHAGTLDPAATGLLAVALGEATKTVPFVAEGQKVYRFAVRWGAATVTDDAEGAFTAECGRRPTPQAIEAALAAFRGDIRQRPPAVSAVKVDGRRAYALTRAGETPELAERDLRVTRLEIVDVPDADHAVLEMACGRGGYVRSIARDLGERLGCLGHVDWLRRLASGAMRVEDAVPLERIELEQNDASRAELLLPVAAGLVGLQCVAVDPETAQRLRHGNAATLEDYGDQPIGSAGLVWARLGEQPVAICRIAGGALHPDRVFACN